MIAVVSLLELVKGHPVDERNHRGGQEKWVSGKIIRRLGSLTYLVQVRAQRRYVHLDHVRPTAESDSYRSVSQNAVPVDQSLVNDESVYQTMSVPEKNQTHLSRNK